MNSSKQPFPPLCAKIHQKASPAAVHFLLCFGVFYLLLQARQLLFAPTSADMASVYPQLLLGDEQHPGDMEIAANKAQVIALTHMYLVHGRSWQHMRPFIEGGGLRCAQVSLLL